MATTLCPVCRGEYEKHWFIICPTCGKVMCLYCYNHEHKRGH